MPKKPSRYGLKYNCIVDVNTAYLLDCQIYLGKNNPADTNEKNCAMSIVLKLTDFYSKSGRCITMDNFFTSVPLARELYDKKLYLIGTLRANKVLKAETFTRN